MRLAQITNWLYVSDRESCNYSPIEFDKIIHIWRSDKPDHSCDFQKQFPLACNDRNLIIDYQAFGCMNAIYYSLLIHYREIANVCRKPLKDIIRWYIQNRNKLDLKPVLLALGSI